jgi:glycosyltransferase involved in cell wall biosynthesis
MKCVVIIPVGPGHGGCALDAEASVREAWAQGPGPFTTLAVDLVDDTGGRMGRSAARNLGMDRSHADWHFLLDADDRMMPGAFGLLDRGVAATFGAICLDGRVSRQNRKNVTRSDLLHYGARGTIAMGCFVRGDLGLRFNAALEQGEDFDFYLRLPSFTKRREPLVSISYRERTVPRLVPARDAGWIEACDRVVATYRGGVR